MRKLFLLAFIIAVGVSCNPPKVVQDSYKVMKGYWVLDEVSYEAPGNYNITLFNDASAACFEGSNWRFIPNNNTGNYVIDNSDCASGQRNFVFTVQEIDKESGLYHFMLKPTNEKGKSDTKTGYRLRLAQLGEYSMTWQQTVQVDGAPFVINMRFSKID